MKDNESVRSTASAHDMVPSLGEPPCAARHPGTQPVAGSAEQVTTRHRWHTAGDGSPQYCRSFMGDGLNAAFGTQLLRARKAAGFARRADFLEKLQCGWPELTLTKLERIELHGASTRAHRPILSALEGVLPPGEVRVLRALFDDIAATSSPGTPGLCMVTVISSSSHQPWLSLVTEILWRCQVVPVIIDPASISKDALPERLAAASFAVVMEPSSPKHRLARRLLGNEGLRVLLLGTRAQVAKRVAANETAVVYTGEIDLAAELTRSVEMQLRDASTRRWNPSRLTAPTGTSAEGSLHYRLNDIEWRFQMSEYDPNCWDAFYRCRRVMTGLHPNGLGEITTEFNRVVGLPFTRARHPNLSVTAVSRSSSGSTVMGEPQLSGRGMTFQQTIRLEPRTQPGEYVDTTVFGMLPAYKFAFRERVEAATKKYEGAPRSIDWAMRPINFPTDRFRMTVFLPEELGAVPIGPRTTRAHYRDSEHEEFLRRCGSYSARQTTSDGVAGWFAELNVERPMIHSSYYIEWTMPLRTK